MGEDVSHLDAELLELPVKLGGLAVEDPVRTASINYSASKRSTMILAEALVTGESLNLDLHEDRVREVQSEERTLNMAAALAKRERLIRDSGLPQRRKRAIDRIAQCHHSSQWLTVVPLQRDDLDLTPTQFRDALAVRYGREPVGLPPYCDGCGTQMDLDHGLNCKKGGLVKQGHDQIRDQCAKMASLAWSSVGLEPVMVDGDDGNPRLVADFKVHGVWNQERTAYFDTRVVNPDAPSYGSLDWNTIAQTAANSKHRKYDAAAEDLRGSFTPLVVACDGSLHKEYDMFLKRVAEVLSEKWAKPLSQVTCWVRVKTQIAVVRAVSMRLRGCRRKVRCLGLEDGALMPL